MKKTVLAVIAVAIVAAVIWILLADRDAEGPLTLYGNVELREVHLAFRQSGRIDAVLVEEGESVAPGTEIARLDDEPLREALAAAEARVAAARANLARLERGLRPQEIEQARAGVSEAEARLVAAEQELARKQRLVDPGATSERELEAARERRDAAQARLDSAREALALAREGFRDEEIAAGRAEVELAVAQLEQARTALEDARLLSPSPGTLLTRAREPGAMVRAGEAVATLSLREPVVVRAWVSEPHLGQVSPGTVVEVTSDSSPQSYRGRVGFVSPRAEFTPKTVQTPELRTDLVYRLRIVVENPDERLLQGMPVTVRLAGTSADSNRAAAAGFSAPETSS